MLFPIIRVRNNAAGGTEHIIGENSHDVLYISKSGGIQYVNIQCMAGTKYPEEGYSFVGIDKGEFSAVLEPEIEMVTFEELINLISSHLEEGSKRKIEAYRELRKYWNNEVEKTRQETGIGRDTGGFLP